MAAAVAGWLRVTAMAPLTGAPHGTNLLLSRCLRAYTERSVLQVVDLGMLAVRRLARGSSMQSAAELGA